MVRCQQQHASIAEAATGMKHIKRTQEGCRIPPHITNIHMKKRPHDRKAKLDGQTGQVLLCCHMLLNLLPAPLPLVGRTKAKQFEQTVVAVSNGIAEELIHSVHTSRFHMYTTERLRNTSSYQIRVVISDLQGAAVCCAVNRHWNEQTSYIIFH